eukprot:6200417-Pleurochrysis_carterae.AAC.2
MRQCHWHLRFDGFGGSEGWSRLAGRRRACCAARAPQAHARTNAHVAGRSAAAMAWVRVQMNPRWASSHEDLSGEHQFKCIAMTVSSELLQKIKPERRTDPRDDNALVDAVNREATARPAQHRERNQDEGSEQSFCTFRQFCPSAQQSSQSVLSCRRLIAASPLAKA